MDKRVSQRSVDLVVVALANLMNLIMVVVFFSRAMGVGRIQVVGWIWGAFVVVLGAVVVWNVRGKRVWWAVVLPLLLLVFLVVEIVLDYVLRDDFRSTALLGPYLLLYYASIMGMIGYAFQVEKRLGFVTLATYFLHQISAFYSYSRVGHG